MGLGVNSLDNINLLVFQVADSDRLVEKSLDSSPPSTVIGSSSISDVFVPSESTPLNLFSKSLREVMVLKETGKITDPEILKEIEGIKLREQTYKDLLAKGESVDEVVALIQNDTKYINETVLDKVKITDNKQNQQNIIYQRSTGEDMSKIADRNATWRQALAAGSKEDMENRIFENIQAEDEKLRNLTQSNTAEGQQEAHRRLKNKEIALESSKGLGIQSLLKEENVSRETKYNEQIQYTIKTNTENLLKNNTRELEELSRIPESDLTVQQRERKETLKDQNQAIEEMMRKEGWLDDYLRNMNEADRKRLEEKAKDGTLDDEETNQILNRGLADSDKSGRIMRGFYTADEEEFRKLMGLDKQSFYDQYSDRYQLDKVLKKEMALSLRQGTYSDASYYGSLDSRAASDGEGAKNSNLSPEQKVANMILERESHGLRGAAAKNFTNKDIAQKLGLKPDHPIVLAIAAGDYGLAQELSVGLNVETSVNAIAAATTEPDNQGFDAWLSFSNSAIPTDNNSVTSTEESNKPFNPFAEDKLSNLNLTFS
jgi:hypothetical protein